jgi:hypothetical protein
LTTAAPAAPAAVLDEDDPGVVPYVVPWPFHPDSAAGSPAPRRAIPDVAGRPLREAIRALHRRGFRVVVKGWGVVDHTWPGAGDSAAAGSHVTLFGSRPVTP